MNAPLPTTLDAIDSMIGRAASRSSWFLMTTSSVILSATSDFTLSSRSAAVARLANWSESIAARRTYPTTSASKIARRP